MVNTTRAKGNMINPYEKWRSAHARYKAQAVSPVAPVAPVPVLSAGTPPSPADIAPAPEPALPNFRSIDGLMSFGDICYGWTPQAWATELRRKAARCRQDHPSTADFYDRWAADIERRLPLGGNAA